MTLPNQRLKLAGVYRSRGSGVLCPSGHTVVQRPCAGGRVARSLSAIRYDAADPEASYGHHALARSQKAATRLH